MRKWFGVKVECMKVIEVLNGLVLEGKGVKFEKVRKGVEEVYLFIFENFEWDIKGEDLNDVLYEVKYELDKMEDELWIKYKEDIEGDSVENRIFIEGSEGFRNMYYVDLVSGYIRGLIGMVDCVEEGR